MDGFVPIDCGGTGSPIPDDSSMLSALMNLDFYEPCSPATTDQIFSALSYSCIQPEQATWASFPSSCVSAQSRDALPEDADIVPGSYSEKKTSQRSDMQFEIPSGFTGMEVIRGSGSHVSSDATDQGPIAIAKPLAGLSLPERMLKALSLFKEYSGGGILAQVWMPVTHGEHRVLSTCEQPFLLDQILAGYREVSRHFTFSAKETPGLFPGLPGRVFMSGMPEWTSNVVYYKKPEYLRMEYAISHEVRGSLAVPVFNPSDGSCCAVLELVTTREKPNFDDDMDNVCNALQSVNLRTVKAHSHHQTLTNNQKSAMTEILDVLRAVCHAHSLPLALTWIPCCCDDGSLKYCYTDDIGRKASLGRKDMLCIQDSACYVNDVTMQDFLHACSEHHLSKGQGIAGKALLSNHPFFSPDVKGYNIREYPMAHHARKFGLRAAVAIRLRSTYTGTDDYILEFFLPVNCTGSEEQQLLLNNLSNTMQKICRSLRTVSDSEIAVDDTTEVSNSKGAGIDSSSDDMANMSSQRPDCDNAPMTGMAFGTHGFASVEHDRDIHHEQSNSVRQIEKKRSTAEKNISLSVLQRYFSGSLKDAAKSIGVCPTTLKRICRQHGISRWPSRKINKVNRSLQKIQTVINSVQGVEGALKYDPATGCLVAAVSSPEKAELRSSDLRNQNVTLISLSQHLETEESVGRLGPECSSHEKRQTETAGQLKQEMDDLSLPSSDSKSIKFACTSGLLERTKIQSMGTQSLYSKEESGYLGGKDGLSQLGLECRNTSKSFSPVVILHDMNAKVEADDGLIEHSHPSSSSMTDSSSGSASSHPIFKNNSKSKELVTSNGPAVTVKATYKDDTVRFKMLPSMGCHHLFDEVARRFKLPIGTFQLKYKDDEEEWVILANDADMQECIEVLESIRSSSVKLQVRDISCAVSSSASSNCLKP